MLCRLVGSYCCSVRILLTMPWHPRRSRFVKLCHFSCLHVCVSVLQVQGYELWTQYQWVWTQSLPEPRQLFWHVWQLHLPVHARFWWPELWAGEFASCCDSQAFVRLKSVPEKKQEYTNPWLEIMYVLCFPPHKMLQCWDTHCNWLVFLQA